jgi:hypothetical protein
MHLAGWGQSYDTTQQTACVVWWCVVFFLAQNSADLSRLLCKDILLYSEAFGIHHCSYDSAYISLKASCKDPDQKKPPTKVTTQH